MKKVLLSLFALMLCSIAQAASWYYAEGVARVSSDSPTGSGLVYVSHSNAGSAHEEPASDATWGTCVKDTAEGEAETRYDYYFYAEPAEGYVFQGWSETDGGTDLGKSNPLVVTITADIEDGYVTRTYYACFSPKLTTEITLQSNTGGRALITDGTKTIEDQGTISTEEATTLTAIPQQGYKVLGWYMLKTDGTKEYFAYTDIVKDHHFVKTCTVGATFIPSDTPAFVIEGHRENPHLSLSNALQAANGKGTITLISSGTVSTGNYNIPQGVTLLIPFDELHTLYTSSPDVEARPLGDITTYTRPTPYSTLTLTEGTHILVDGAISVSARQASLSASLAGNQTAGGVVGPYGCIYMGQGSSITLQSGASLYAWGFITGPGVTDCNRQSGHIVAQAGSKIWESFQIANWRGGTATTAMGDSIACRVLPFNQYYIQNIECPITFQTGATETLCTSVFMGDGSSNSAPKPYAGSFRFISNEPALFTLTEGEITKQYDGTTDRLMLSISGNATISDMALTLGDYLVSTTQFNFPLTGNIDLDVASGVTTLAQDVELLPGTNVHIGREGSLCIPENHALYMYDADEWGPYAGTNRTIMPLLADNVPSICIDRSQEPLSDANITVAGTMTVNGHLYTTTSGASISGEHGGTIEFTATEDGNPALYEVTQSGVSVFYHKIPISYPRLLQGNGNYLETNNGIYHYTTTGAYPHWYSGSLDGIETHLSTQATNSFYDLSGRRLQHTNRPGLYIQNGKIINHQ